MPWYAYVAFLVLAVIGYYVIVEIKTKKALKEKKSADRKAAKAAAKKSKSAKKNLSHANKLEFLKKTFSKIVDKRQKICYIN